MKRYIQIKSIIQHIAKAIIMNYNIRHYSLVFLLFLGLHAQAQNPNWSVNYADFDPATMIVVIAISDECVPSADAGDIVAAFNANGEIRGVATTNINNKALLTIGSNLVDEIIYFKVYDAGSNTVYDIHNTSVVHKGETDIGTLLEPFILNFDSNPTSSSGGPDLWIVEANSTNLNATGEGNWNLIPGEVGIIADPSDPKSLFTGEIGTTYLLAWTLSDAEGCIGETDVVSVTFSVSMTEDTPERCSDGFDNDGDGLVDCQEASCGQVALTTVSKIDPTPLTCATETSNGEIEITHTGATSFSIDGGSTSHAMSTFTGLEVGDYSIIIINDFAGCTDTGSIALINTLSAEPPVAAFSLDGPTTICAGNDNVNYNIDQALIGNLIWSYTGADATINSSGTTGLANFGDNATTGILKAVMANACTSFADSMQIEIANSFLCSTFSNCIPIVTVSNSLLESANSPNVFQAGNELLSDAILYNNNFEFSAGQSLQLNEGFSVATGINFIADIKNCTP